MPDKTLSGAKALNELLAIRNRYGSDAEQRKLELVEFLTKKPPQAVRALAKFHDCLLFLRAFPGSRDTLIAALLALDLFETWLRKTPRAARASLDDTGMAGSKSRHVFPFPIAHWLARRAGDEAEIDWRHYDNVARLDPALRAVARASELDGVDSGHFSTREWIAIARRPDMPSDLHWIVEALCAERSVDADQLWERAEPPLVWDLKNSQWSVTHNALRRQPPTMRRAMRRPEPDTVRRIATPLRKAAPLIARDAQKVLDVARAALTARCREVVPTSYANPSEVHWCELGEGAALAVIGATPRHRMSIEANYGYVLFSNGAPIGYGGVTALFRQANTGLNIFDPYRGGEAAFLWIEMLRAFHTLFGVKRFIVNAYQFGEGNAEAITSGAYWFYYKLGFRPSAPAQQRAAAREAKRLARSGAKRSTAATLKSLAIGDLLLDLPGFHERDHFDEELLPRLGAGAAQMIAAEPVSSRETAERQIAAKLAKLLGVQSMRNWPAPERRAFTALAPAISIVPGMEKWSTDERKALVAMMRAKAAPQENKFARAAGKCPRFFRALARQLEAAPSI